MGVNSRILLLVGVVAIQLSLSSAVLGQSKTEYVAGELLVKFGSTQNEQIDQAVRTIGAKVVQKLKRISVSRLQLPASLSVEQGMQKLAQLPFVRYVEPNYVLKALGNPNDPKFNQQWGLEKIAVQRGWGRQTGSAKVVIAIVDTGVDLDHPDLKQKIVAGYDFVDRDNSADDVGGHGTHCAGIAAASANNGTGIAGVCPNCSIMPIRVLGPWGGSASAVADGVIWAADHGAKVISMSLGSAYKSAAVEDAVAYAAQRGALSIAASGNNASQARSYPAGLLQCFAVGSSDQYDRRSSFSNYGSWVDVAAPGSQIMSSVPNGRYEYKSGTSMATPHVAGLAGLLFSCPGATADKVQQAIEQSARPVGDWVAKGRIDVPGALSRMSCGGGTPSPDPPPPQPGPGKRLEASPTGYVMTQGHTVSAPSNSLVRVDGQRLVVQGRKTSYKNVLSMDVVTTKLSRKNANQLEVVLTGSFDKPGEITAYFYDWQGKKWDWIGKHYLKSKDQKLSFKRAPAQPYISTNGQVKVRFYREAKRWTVFSLRADQVRFYVTQNASAPSNQGIKDKAKNWWNKWKRKK